MSKECIRNCPRIQAEVENFNPDQYPTIATAGILAACEASYDCPGPNVTEGEVAVGVFRRRTEQAQIVTCGLPE